METFSTSQRRKQRPVRKGGFFFFRVTLSTTNTNTRTRSVQLSYLAQRRGAAPCGAVRCRAVRAVPCFAVLCRALHSVLFRAYQTTTLASIQSLPEPACMSSSIYTAAACCLQFPLIFGLQQTSSSGTYAATNSSTAVCTSMYVVEPRAQQSAAQSPLHKAANQVRADQSTYQKKYSMYVPHPGR